MSDNKAMNEWIRNRGRAPVAATKKPPAPASAATCKNMKGARLVADALGLVDTDGQINWQALGEEAPEFFAPTSVVPRGNAGSGAGTPPPDTRSLSQRVSDAIRRAAGRW